MLTAVVVCRRSRLHKHGGVAMTPLCFSWNSLTALRHKATARACSADNTQCCRVGVGLAPQVSRTSGRRTCTWWCTHRPLLAILANLQVQLGLHAVVVVTCRARGHTVPPCPTACPTARDCGRAHQPAAAVPAHLLTAVRKRNAELVVQARNFERQYADLRASVQVRMHWACMLCADLVSCFGLHAGLLQQRRRDVSSLLDARSVPDDCAWVSVGALRKWLSGDDICASEIGTSCALPDVSLR